MKRPDLVQKTVFPARRRAFAISDDLKSIQVEDEGRGKLTEYSVPFDLFDPNPTRQKHTDRSWVTALVILGIVLSITGLPAFGMILEGDSFGMWFFVVIAAIAMPVYLRFLYQSRSRSLNALIYLNRYSSQPVLVLDWNKPNEEEFEAFRDRLEEQIPALSASSGLGGDDLSAQLHDLAKLRERNVLSEEEFTQFKAKLLAGELSGDRRIGFSA